MNAISLEILTPEKLALKSEVGSVEVQGEFGRIGILPEHTALISKLGFGALEYQIDSQKETLICGYGILEVLDNHVTVLVDSCEHPDEIDKNRAEAAKKRAERRLIEKEESIDLNRASLALHRAIKRIQYSK